jgi:hypothetical protein
MLPAIASGMKKNRENRSWNKRHKKKIRIWWTQPGASTWPEADPGNSERQGGTVSAKTLILACEKFIKYIYGQ